MELEGVSGQLLGCAPAEQPSTPEHVLKMAERRQGGSRSQRDSVEKGLVLRQTRPFQNKSWCQPQGLEKDCEEKGSGLQPPHDSHPSAVHADLAAVSCQRFENVLISNHSSKRRLTCQLRSNSTDLSRLLFPLVSVDQCEQPFPGGPREVLAAAAAPL